ncbi:MAG: hypothetical protein WC279_11760, partial [Sulfurimonas sp.]|uniref:hypothetical protein n=1 Tax=Sulfurimonas sp. TaxID=2022749 RepID=UPI003564A686
MINITTPNNSNTFFVKADGADYIQCPVAEAEGIAVLRYIPVGADSVEGEVYAIGSIAVTVSPLTVVDGMNFIVSGTSVSLKGKTIKIQILDGATWVDCTGTDVIASDGTWSVTAYTTGITAGATKLRAVVGLTLSDEEDTTFEEVWIAFDALGTITAGTPYTLTGTSNRIGLHLDISQRVSSPEGSWTFIGQAAVQGDGTWSDEVTVTDAGTFDLRVEDADDSSRYAQLDDVFVASGVVLTALQITNASDAATKDSIFVKETRLVGDNILVFCITKSSKIKIGSTNYETGLGTTNAVGRCFIASIAKNHEVNWINFYDWEQGYSELFSGNAMLLSGSSVFVVDHYKPSTNIVSRIHKIALSDGTYSTLSLTATGGHAGAVCIGGIYDNDIIVGGRDLGVTWGRSVFWKVKTDLSSQTVHASGFSGSLNAYKNNAYVAFNTHVFSNDSGGDGAFYLIDPSSSWGANGSNNNGISYVSRINIGDMASSASRVLFFISAASTIIGTQLG